MGRYKGVYDLPGGFMTLHKRGIWDNGRTFIDFPGGVYDTS